MWLLSVPATGLGAAAPAPSTSRAFTVVSLNLAMREDVDRVASELAAIGAARTADLILLQEVVRRGTEPDMAQQLGERLGLESAYAEAFAVDERRTVGLALLSRYPQHRSRVLGLRTFDIGFRSRTRIALAAVVDTPAGPVHVYNVHLDTRINLPQRLEQLSAVAHDVTTLPGPAIVGGDFNTNNIRWIFHAIPLPFIGGQGVGVQRFMERLGFRSVYARGRATHDALGMQLDWMFLRGLQAAAASVTPVALSDHHALVMSLVPHQPPSPSGP